MWHARGRPSRDQSMSAIPLVPRHTATSCLLASARSVGWLVAVTLLAATVDSRAAIAEATPCRDPHRPAPAACTLAFSGSISARDALALTGILHRMDPAHTLLLVRFDSGGGDAHAAMKIGRALRVASAHGYVPPRGRCFSACVLALAGASSRAIHGRVGIHRPEPVDAAMLSRAEALRRAEEGAREIRAYLAEMRISKRLYDAMVEVPPKDMRVLTPAELRAFGLLREESTSSRQEGR